MTYSASIAAASSATCTAVATVLSVAAISNHSSNYPTHTGSGDDDVEDLPGSGDDGGLLLGSGDDDGGDLRGSGDDNGGRDGLRENNSFSVARGEGRTASQRLSAEKQLHSCSEEREDQWLGRGRHLQSERAASQRLGGGADIFSLKGLLHSCLWR